jgi:hypothetical protein
MKNTRKTYRIENSFGWNCSSRRVLSISGVNPFVSWMFRGVWSSLESSLRVSSCVKFENNTLKTILIQFKTFCLEALVACRDKLDPVSSRGATSRSAQTLIFIRIANWFLVFAIPGAYELRFAHRFRLRSRFLEIFPMIPKTPSKLVKILWT